MNKEPKVYTLPVEDIVNPENRARQEFKRKEMEELVDSIRKYGLIQPGVCRKEDEDYVLFVGERRLRACEQAGAPFSFTLREETDELKILEIELEENLRRVDLTFQEEVTGLEKLHRLKQEQSGVSTSGASGGHGIADTAEYLGRSEGIVSEDLELAAFLEIDEVRDAKNKTEAKKVIKRIKEEFRTSKALKAAREGPQPPEAELDENATESMRQAARAVELKEKVEFFGKRIHLGKMEAILPEYADGFFDVVCFDPPWGVDFDKVKKETGSTRNYEDSPEKFFTSLEGWLSLLYQKMSTDSHLYMFFGMGAAWENEECPEEEILDEGFRFRDRVYDIFEKIGFKTNRMPLIWFKQGAHRTRNPDVWPGRSYEPIAYARKGSKPLIRKGAPDVIVTPAPTPTIKGTHPSAKHPMIYIELLQRSCSPGDKILDPMCGSGMMAVAAETLRITHQLDWHMIEKEESFQELSLFNTIKGYHYLTNIDTVTPELRTDPVEEKLPFYVCIECGESGTMASVPIRKADGRKVCPACGGSLTLSGTDVPENFKEINIHEDNIFVKAMWMAHWKKYPENQERMLKWKKLHEDDI